MICDVAFRIRSSKLLRNNPAWSVKSHRRGKKEIRSLIRFAVFLLGWWNVPGVFWVMSCPCRWQLEALLFGPVWVTWTGVQMIQISPKRRASAVCLWDQSVKHVYGGWRRGADRPTRYRQTRNCDESEPPAAGSHGRCWRWRSWQASAHPAAEHRRRLWVCQLLHSSRTVLVGKSVLQLRDDREGAFVKKYWEFMTIGNRIPVDCGFLLAKVWH